LRVLKTKGASEDILREPAFTSLLVDAVFKKHFNKIFSDPASLEEIILAHCQTASPSVLPKMAVQDREKGNLECAYYLEVVADCGNGESSLKSTSASQKKCISGRSINLRNAPAPSAAKY
jgi:hypothetical protein